MACDIVLSGGPAGGALFETDALSWPPPKDIRVVTGGPNGPELLDEPGDEVRPGEHLHVYRQQFHGHFCQRSSCRLVASYVFGRSAPAPQPSLFEAGIRALT